MRTKCSFIVSIALLASLAFSCSQDEGTAGWDVEEGAGDETDYDDDSTVVVAPGDADDETTIITGDGDGCVELDSGECVDPSEAKQEYCGDEAAKADIILDDEGNVVDVICYPPQEDGTPIDEVAQDEEGNAEVPQSDNGAVVVFDESTDGEPIEGDVTLTAERVSIFGNGVDNTTIDGNLTFSSNNATARGLTVTGNVELDKVSNGSSIAFCRVEGNLIVNSNEATVANCQVFGNVEVSGNNATLVNVGVQGDWDVNPSAYCEGCYSFDDGDGDFDVADEEIGDDLTCDGENGANGAMTNNTPGM